MSGRILRGLDNYTSVIFNNTPIPISQRVKDKCQCTLSMTEIFAPLIIIFYSVVLTILFVCTLYFFSGYTFVEFATSRNKDDQKSHWYIYINRSIYHQIPLATNDSGERLEVGGKKFRMVCQPSKWYGWYLEVCRIVRTLN